MLGRNKKRKGGFTLVELLAVFAILSLVLSFGTYSITKIINSSKNKSYETTMNNIAVAGSNYTLENLELSAWTLNGETEYQCIRVKDLITAGYFKGDVLESEVSDGLTVSETDFVYVERNKSTKAITNKRYEGKNTKNNKCISDKYNIGTIDFEVDPSGWSQSKKVKIIYTLNSKDNDKNYTYSFSYSGECTSDGNDKCSVSSKMDKLSVSEVTGKLENIGSLTAMLSDGVNKPVERTLYISKIDTENPVGTIGVEPKNVDKQIVTLTLTDSQSGVKSYYWGTNSNPTLSMYENVANLNKVEVTKKIDSTDKAWYLSVMDMSGRVSELRNTQIYTIHYEANGGTGAPEDQIAIKDATINLSNKEPTWSGSLYNFDGWSLVKDGELDYVAGASYKVTGNITLYARWKEHEHNFITLGKTIFDVGSFSYFHCGYYHDRGLVRYCDKCQMAAVYYNEHNNKDESTLYCPCHAKNEFNNHNNGVFFDDSIFGTREYSKLRNMAGGFFHSSYDMKEITKASKVEQECEQHNRYIIYDLQGGSGSFPKVNIKGKEVYISSNTPTKNGYTFNGWNTKKDGKGTSYKKGQDIIHKIVNGKNKVVYNGQDLKLYAQWKAKDDSKTYTITLDKTGGSGGTDILYANSKTGVYLDKSYSKKMSTSSNPINKPSKNLYSFDGYYTSSTGGVRVINSNGYIESTFKASDYTSNITLYARWIFNNSLKDGNIKITTCNMIREGKDAGNSFTPVVKINCFATTTPKNAEIGATRGNVSGDSSNVSVDVNQDLHRITLSNLYSSTDNTFKVNIKSFATDNYSASYSELIVVRFGHTWKWTLLGDPRRNNSWSSEQIENKKNSLLSSGYSGCKVEKECQWNHLFKNATYSGTILCWK